MRESPIIDGSNGSDSVYRAGVTLEVHSLLRWSPAG